MISTRDKSGAFQWPISLIFNAVSTDLLQPFMLTLLVIKLICILVARAFRYLTISLRQKYFGFMYYLNFIALNIARNGQAMFYLFIYLILFIHGN